MDAYYAGFIRRRDTELSHSNSVPSFSSSLLDSVYRSIEGGGKEELAVDYRDTMRKKLGNNRDTGAGGRGSVLKGRNAGGDDAEGFRRIERWTGEERAVARRNSAVEVDRKLSRMWNSSSSGSSDSSSGVFSSSELEPVSGVPAGPSCYGLNRGRPKPVRTGNEHQGKKTKKSRARKISGDLKKVKQPVSPGGRLASFLNSLFTARKAKFPSSAGGSDEDRRTKSLNASACSSASSYSRSCLSKSTTASTAGATVTPSSAVKRSVRFYPVSVIVDEDNRPCGHKNLDVPVKTEKNRRAEAEAAAARDLLRTYQKKVEREFGLTRKNVIKNLKVYEEDEDDADSYASSDLFELENLSAVGMQRYGEELPVYETTNLGTNRAIASGLIL